MCLRHEKSSVTVYLNAKMIRLSRFCIEADGFTMCKSNGMVERFKLYVLTLLVEATRKLRITTRRLTDKPISIFSPRFYFPT